MIHRNKISLVHLYDKRFTVICFPVSKAILKAKVVGFQLDSFDLFPINCCEFSSNPLAKFLIEKIGLSSLEIAIGENRYKNHTDMFG